MNVIYVSSPAVGTSRKIHISRFSAAMGMLAFVVVFLSLGFLSESPTRGDSPEAFRVWFAKSIWRQPSMAPSQA